MHGKMKEALVTFQDVKEVKALFRQRDFTLLTEDEIWQTEDGTEDTPRTKTVWRWVYAAPDGMVAFLTQDDWFAPLYWRLCQRKAGENSWFPQVVWQYETFGAGEQGWAIALMEPLRLLEDTAFRSLLEDLRWVCSDGDTGGWVLEEGEEYPNPPAEMVRWGHLVVNPWKELKEDGLSGVPEALPYLNSQVFGRRADGSIACLLPWTSVPGKWVKE
jgi:hypothetical protein